MYFMGFDSFGLPAENAAIKEGGHHMILPREIWLQLLNKLREWDSLDWRNGKSHDPNYYKWNQWFFTKFMENG